jgi:hypothetical protein
MSDTIEHRDHARRVAPLRATRANDSEKTDDSLAGSHSVRHTGGGACSPPPNQNAPHEMSLRNAELRNP